MPMDTPQSDLIGTEEASRILRVDTSTVRRWAALGGIPTAVVTVGGHRRYRRADVVALLATERVAS